MIAGVVLVLLNLLGNKYNNIFFACIRALIIYGFIHKKVVMRSGKIPVRFMNWDLFLPIKKDFTTKYAYMYCTLVLNEATLNSVSFRLNIPRINTCFFNKRVLA